MPKLLKVPAAAESLGISKQKLWAMIYARELDVVRIGRAVRIPEQTITALVERNLTPARVA